MITLALFVVWCWATVHFLTSSKDDLNKATFILKEVRFGSETEERMIRDKVSHYVDIEVKEQPYFIHLSDEFHMEAWDKIHQYSAGDTLEVLYYDYLLQSTVLNNPSELNINGNSIFSYEDTQKEILWILTGVLTGTLIFGFFSFLLYRTYKQLMWEGDKAIYAQSKWIFFKRFFRGN